MDRSSLRSPARRQNFLLWLVAALLPYSHATGQVMTTSMLPPPPDRVTVDQNNVDVVSGSLVHSQTVLSVGPPDYGLVLKLFHMGNSLWRDSMSGQLMVYTDPTGASSFHSSTASWGNQTWSFPDFSTVSRNGDGTVLSDQANVLTMRDGTVITYGLELPFPGYECQLVQAPCTQWYVPTTVAYPNGVILTLHYRVLPVGLFPDARLQSVTNNAGYQIKFVYASNDANDIVASKTRVGAIAINNAVEYCDPNADTCNVSASWARVSYSDINDGNYTGTFTVTDALSRSTRYSYAPTSFSVKTPGSATDVYQYTLALVTDTRLATLVLHTTSATVGGNLWSYAYVPGASGDQKITSTDPQGHQTAYNSSIADSGTALASRTDALNRKMAFDYPCADLFPPNQFNYSTYKVTEPEGNAMTHNCDDRGNVTSTTLIPKPGSNLQSIGTSATFPPACANPKTCNKPTAVVDGRNLETDYGYYPEHGGVKTETLPASGYAPTYGIQPKKHYSYAQIYAYVKNSTGALVQADSPVWMPTQISECRMSASCAGQPDEILTTFEYAAVGSVNRLLVRGKVVTWNGVSQRTCYGYDNFGNQTSVTTPRAGLSVCP